MYWQIISHKIGTTESRAWNGVLFKETEEMLMFRAEFEQKLIHPELGVLHRGTISYEYFWKSEWFNVFRLHDRRDRFLTYYCNICRPPIVGDNRLEYVDLELDILVEKNLQYRLLDESEFEKLAITPDTRCKATLGLSKALEKIARAEFPFDFA
jgi:uncharacterized protein